MTHSQANQSSTVDGQAIQSLQQALASEHAAVWVYGLITAFISHAFDHAVADATSAHQERRDSTERLLREAGASPAIAEPAYTPPSPVTDQTSAITLAITAETDTATAWHKVIEHTTNQQLRRIALEALTATAVQATRWRKAIGKNPATVAFPGANSQR